MSPGSLIVRSRDGGNNMSLTDHAQEVKQSTRETDSLSEFWEKVISWAAGPRASMGFEAEGFKCLPL